jgi:SAM-dependent methyltransferase
VNTQAQMACRPEEFERRYQRHADPWQFAASPYEQGRYHTLLAALQRPRYERAYEPGCSIGEFTALLAPRCGHLLASDVSHTAVAAARLRCASHRHVEIVVGVLPQQLPDVTFDLIVFSELGYYFPERQLEVLATSLYERLRAGGELIATHWLGHSADHWMHGDEVGRVLAQSLPSQQSICDRHDGFRIDAWRRP